MVKDDIRLKEIEQELLKIPASPDKAVGARGPCIYAWWLKRSALENTEPSIPLVNANENSEWNLLYIGGSPESPRHIDRQLDRVVRNHYKGNIGSSTLRFSLAVLLEKHLGLEPVANQLRPKISSEHVLTNWIAANCGITLVKENEPWEYEKEVVHLLNPPLNIRRGSHEFRYPLNEARKAFLAKCGIKRSTSLQ